MLKHEVEETGLGAVFSASPEAITISNLNGKIIECNQATLVLHGFSSKEELIGKSAFEFIAKKDHKRAMENLKKTLEQGPVRNIEYTFLTKDGHKFSAELSASVVKDTSGNPIGFVAITKDITERKRMEEELQRYSKHLEELVEERTRNLRAVERLAAIGEVAAMVGHDLRNPLQVVVNTTYLEKEMVTSMPSPCRELAEKRGVYELFETVGKQIEYMNKIVSDLQDFARPLKPEFVETSLHQLINETLSMVTVPETVKVSLVIDEDFPKLMVDHTLMKRVLINLITNALQAMPNGGKLIVRLSRTEEAAFISVEDTGVGIPKETLDKLFSPLFTTKPKGSGFGLPVCKRLVEAHGGSIMVESKVGRGSTFTVKLPLGKEVR